MDKYEYKVRAEEIKALIEEGEYAEAVKIADTIDWRRVRSVMMLCTVSDLYKINRRYQESKDILLLANDKRPSSRAIVYSLCELSIKMDNLSEAYAYYQQFIQIAPKDTGRYVLLYRIFEAQEVSLEERIAVLEEFKKREYREKWAYELAYLYHRIGLTTKCIEECDEMYLWFGEGKYVLKALELKLLHVPLSVEQQEKYDLWIKQRDEEIAEENEEVQESENEGADEQSQSAPDIELSDKGGSEKGNSDLMSMPTNELPEVKTVDVGQYNTLNLQMVVAEGLKELMPEESEEAPQSELQQTEEEQTRIFEKVPVEPEPESMPEPSVSIAEQLIAPLLQETSELPDVEDVEKEYIIDPIPTGEIKAYPEEAITDQAARIITNPILELKSASEEIITNPAAEMEAAPEEIITNPAVEIESAPEEIITNPAAEIESAPKEIITNPVAEIQSIPKEIITNPGVEIQSTPEPEITPGINQNKYDYVLSQEYDGQISLVVPEQKVVEKQITGQLSIEDIMAGWEEMKKSNEQKRMEDVRKRILSRTGSLFADFDEATRNGLLEELEKAFVAAMQDSDKESAIKKVVYPSGIESKLSSDIKTQLQQAVDDVASETAALLLDNESSEEAAMDETAVEDSEEIEEPATTQPQHEIPQPARDLTNEEKELFGRHAQHRKSKDQLINTLDNMSMAAYTGNVIITGEEDGDSLSLAKNLIREMQYNDSNFSGKVAKISAAALNKKDMADTLKRLSNGALIIEKAADLSSENVLKLNKVLENENIGLLLIMEDSKRRMNNLLSNNASLTTCFNLRIDIEPLDDEELVAYAKQYAHENEYSIDEFGVLALHTRIADMQTSDHEVSVSEVKELVDNAIYYANKKTAGHFFDILLAKRYDEDDMIILREKDFMHY